MYLIPALGHFEAWEWWVQDQLALHVDSLPQNECAFKVYPCQAIVPDLVAVQMQWVKSPALPTDSELLWVWPQKSAFSADGSDVGDFLDRTWRIIQAPKRGVLGKQRRPG